MSSCAVDSPIGPLTLVEDDGWVTAVRFGRREAVGGEPAAPVLRAAAAQLEEYFAGERRTFELPLRFPENGLERRVVEALAEIPYGETWSYGEVTERLGLPLGEVRDVAAAIGRQPLAIIIPCHRVIGADGRLVGYGGGLARKARLLELEAPQLQLI
jgi:methylated-DNA-[protein]-cysteine S-methyltransferase